MHKGMRLGKLAPKVDHRTLKLASYIDESKLPVIPPKVLWGNKVRVWPMFLNDKIGDCTIAGAAHMVETWDINVGKGFVMTEADVLGAYSYVSGFNNLTGANDNGAVELDVLNFWRKVGIGGHHINAYTAVNMKSERDARLAIWMFGGLYIGLDLPITAQDQTIWDVPSQSDLKFGDGAPGTWGGHAVNITGFDDKYVHLVTWGKEKLATWAFYHAYCDEAYGVVSKEWVSTHGVTPSGFSYNDLLSDLDLVTR